MKYQTKLPIIIEKSPECRLLPPIKNPKFIMAKTFTIAEVQTTVRAKLELPSSDGLLLLAGGQILKSGQVLEEVYAKFADQDGFLYLVYAQENIYG